MLLRHVVHTIVIHQLLLLRLVCVDFICQPVSREVVACNVVVCAAVVCSCDDQRHASAGGTQKIVVFVPACVLTQAVC